MPACEVKRGTGVPAGGRFPDDSVRQRASSSASDEHQAEADDSDSDSEPAAVFKLNRAQEIRSKVN